MRKCYDKKTKEFVSRPLRLKGAIARLADADEVSEDEVITYSELKGNLLTLGWNNHQMVDLVEVDLNGDVVSDDDVYDSGTPSVYARFCAMNEREQTSFMYELTMHICRLVGVCVTVWAPSDEFVLSAIELEVSSDQLRRAARSAYAEYLRSTDSPFKDPKPDSPESEADDTIRVSQQSTRGSKTLKTSRDLRDPGHRSRQSRTMVPKKNVEKFPTRLTGGKWSRWRGKMESHSTKYGRQDYRHQLPRMEAKFDRRFAAYEAMWADEEEQVDTLEAQMVDFDHRERFERDVAELDWDSRLAYSRDALDEALDEMMDIRLYGTRYVRASLSWEDELFHDWVDGIHDNCNCKDCTGEVRKAPTRSRADNIVDGYTLTRREVLAEIARDLGRIDTAEPSFSSGKRGSYRYRGEPRKSERDESRLSL